MLSKKENCMKTVKENGMKTEKKAVHLFGVTARELSDLIREADGEYQR